MSTYIKTLLLVALFSVTCSTLHAGAETKYWAMFVGIDQYSAEYGVTPLGACVKDVNDVHTALTAESSRWAANQVAKYTNEVATISTIQATLKTMAESNVDENDVFLYFQSSHGGEYSGKDTFLCLHDSDYTDSDMAADLAQFRDDATIIVIIDACNSGGMFKSGEKAPVWNFAANVMTKLETKLKEKGRSGRGPSIGWMTAADYNETCSETVDNGIFTSYIVKAFEGYGDSSGDGYVTFKEAFDYANPLATAENLTQHAQSYNDETLTATVAIKADNPSPGTTTPTTTTTTTSTTTSGGGSQTVFLTTTTTIPEDFTRATINDFNGDAFSDLAVYDKSSASWYVSTITGSILTWGAECGSETCIPVSGDFNGDGMCDLTLFDTESFSWYSASIYGDIILWGMSSGSMGDTPVSGDYNGDGRDDLTVFDSSSGAWYSMETDGIILHWGTQWGWEGAIPVSGDYNGDQKSDLAVFDNQTAQWYILSSEKELITWAKQWGWQGAVPVSGDYDGDGKNDLAVFDNSNGYWYVISTDGTVIVWGVQWGWEGAVPVSGDYDGDGKSDLAVFDNSNGYWYVLSTDGTVILWAKQWGWSGADISAR